MTPKFCLWVRIFGYGFCISRMQPLFSERYGYKKIYRFFGLKLTFLRAGK